MKNSVLSLFALLLAFSACKKEENDPNPTNPQSQYYMKFKLDGVQISYTQASLASQLAGQWNNLSNGNYICNAVGFKDASIGPSKDYMGVFIIHPQPVEIGKTYTTNQSTQVGAIQSNLLGFTYLNSSGVTFVCNFGTDALGNASNGKLVFTEETTTTIKGTFQGNFYQTGSAQAVVVTDGEFLVRKY